MSRKNQIIYCNCCGKEICAESLAEHTSFLTVKKEWGYFSHKKDGKIHSADICEECCQKLAETFAIPPEEEEITEFV